MKIANSVFGAPNAPNAFTILALYYHTMNYSITFETNINASNHAKPLKLIKLHSKTTVSCRDSLSKPPFSQMNLRKADY